MSLLIFIFCHSISLAIRFAISKDSFALCEKKSKQIVFVALQSQMEIIGQIIYCICFHAPSCVKEVKDAVSGIKEKASAKASQLMNGAKTAAAKAVLEIQWALLFCHRVDYLAQSHYIIY